MSKNNSSIISELIRKISIQEQAQLGLALKSSSVTVQQAMLLKYIGKNPGAIQADIVKITKRRAATVSTLLGKMEKNGLITRTIPATNTRNKELNLTQHGHDVVKIFSTAQSQVEQQLVNNLSEIQQNELINLLKKIK